MRKVWTYSTHNIRRKVFTTPLLTEANQRRNTKQNPRCQRGGVRSVQIKIRYQSEWHYKPNDFPASKPNTKNHVGRPMKCDRVSISEQFRCKSQDIRVRVAFAVDRNESYRCSRVDRERIRIRR